VVHSIFIKGEIKVMNRSRNRSEVPPRRNKLVFRGEVIALLTFAQLDRVVSGVGSTVTIDPDNCPPPIGLRRVDTTTIIV
jgi:hypothetical protein